MASWSSSSDESDFCVIPDPDESFELRLAEVEKGKSELWTLYKSGAEAGMTHINQVLDAVGFLYGERVRDEVRGGLRWLLADPESLSQIGLIVGLRERHLWVHDGHFDVLSWGSVDLYAYLEKYGIECSGNNRSLGRTAIRCSCVVCSCMKTSSPCTAAIENETFGSCTTPFSQHMEIVWKPS
jgi:hypothetical protein